MPKPTLENLIEALLFVANEPLTTERIAALCECSPAEAETALASLAVTRSDQGLRISHLNGAYRLVSAPAADAVIRRYLEAETRSDLTKPALETLAIIAYRGPITKAQLDEVRGVTSDTMIRNLLQRGLISEQGKSQEPGKPTLYGVSHEFLQHFGLASLADLPPLEEPAQS